MKKTGDDELDFIREASSEIFNFQAKAAVVAIGSEIVGLGILSGLIALLSTTVALWVLTILGAFIIFQIVLLTAAQWKARKFIKKHTESTEAVDKITGPIGF